MERDGHPCVLIVARLERTHFVPSIGYFKPVRIPAKILTVLHQGLLGQVDDEIAQALILYLRALLATKEADAVAYHQLPEDSPLLHALLSNGTRLWSEKNPASSLHWSMSLPEEPGLLLKKLRSKHRSWIKKKERELTAAFPDQVVWRWLNCFDDLPGLCGRLENVAARTYQRGLGAGFVNDEEHYQRFALFARREQLRVCLVEIEGKVRAFWIGVVYKGAFHSWETGYDQDFREYELGTLVFVHMVDELVCERICKLDFGLGDASYKQRFGDKCWREATIRMFAPTTKGLSLRLVLAVSGLLDGSLRKLIKKAGLLERLKTGWRRHLTPADSEARK